MSPDSVWISMMGISKFGDSQGNNWQLVLLENMTIMGAAAWWFGEASGLEDVPTLCCSGEALWMLNVTWMMSLGFKWSPKWGYFVTDTFSWMIMRHVTEHESFKTNRTPTMLLAFIGQLVPQTWTPSSTCGTCLDELFMACPSVPTLWMPWK